MTITLHGMHNLAKIYFEHYTKFCCKSCKKHSITAFTQCSDCGVEPQMRGQTRLLPLSVNGIHLPRLRCLTRLLCSSKWAGFDPRCGVWHRIFVVCKEKAGSAPAMYGTFPCIAREILYLSSFILPQLRGLLLERDHCVNAGQWPPPPPLPQDRSDPPPGLDPGIGALCKHGIYLSDVVPV